MEDQIKNPEDKSIEDLAETLHSQAEEDTLMKQDQEEKFTEEVVQTPEMEDEQSTQEVVETPEVEEEEKEPEESPDLKQTEAGQAGLQEMESGEETKLSWAAVVANKYKSSKTREKKVEELEEVSDLKQTRPERKCCRKRKTETRNNMRGEEKRR
ncbi:hypothetical protein CgunFtcFv8_020114 [Champsocephalus gunnari]|uniref:Uncharacterized protein n=1 Tax=Champsocephalus gunnari TaxID=52237 RepID=A0AAN8DGP9_CHAGU|nr:hypothetical protein CgunFtcFv8_020114 [Champsocephalus gunnari]